MGSYVFIPIVVDMLLSTTHTFPAKWSKTASRAARFVTL